MDEEKQKYEYRGIGLNKSEKYFGQKKFDEYCSIYHINAYSDLQLLEEVVYREILQEQFKVQIEEKKKETEKKNKTLAEKDQKEIVIPSYVVDSMNKNLEQVLVLKEKLGLLANREGDDTFKYLQLLKDKFAKWMEENQASRTLVCPHCSKIIMLKIRTEIWESQQHPFFKDKTLYNEHLINMYLANKITAEDVSKVLGTSPKYTEWLVEKYKQRKTKETE